MAEQTLTREAVLEQLKQVYDPEVPINVVDLGLIYDVKVNEGNVSVQMSLTAPGCPLGAYIAQQVQRAILELDGVEDANVEMVFEPPWSPEMMSGDAKKQLGID